MVAIGERTRCGARARKGKPWEESLTYDLYRNKVFVTRGRNKHALGIYPFRFFNV
jgi:hypothetical protein